MFEDFGGGGAYRDSSGFCAQGLSDLSIPTALLLLSFGI